MNHQKNGEALEQNNRLQQKNDEALQQKNGRTLQRVLIMAGGTGGHVFPGLALARYMQNQGIEVSWLGTEKGLESRLVPEAHIPLHFIRIQGLRGKGVKSLLSAPFKILAAIFQAKQIIQRVQPDLVIGMGGFVSGPGGVASRLLKCPLIIHEQNAKAGLTNKLLGYVAHQILEGFPQTFQSKAITTGNPVRVEIEQIPPPLPKTSSSPNSITSLSVKPKTSLSLNPITSPSVKPFRLLIIGGSLGAKVLNELIPEALSLLPEEIRPEIWHQTGDKHFSDTEKKYAALQVSANLQPFISDMAQAYQWADVVICRAGALTVSELCAAGRGAIFVPYPHAVDDHQTANALFMVNEGAAFCIQQRDLTAQKLADQLRAFGQQPETYLSMAKAAYGLRKTQVTEKIYEICQKVYLSEENGH